MTRCGKRTKKGGMRAATHCAEKSTRFFRVATDVRNVALQPYIARCSSHAKEILDRNSVFTEVDENEYVVGMVMET